MKPPLIATISLCCLAFTAGCRLLKPAEDPIRYFSLAAAAAAAEAPAGGPSVGLAPVVFPGYLMRDAIVVRRGPNELVYRAFDRWPDRLDREVSRVMAADLATRVGPGRVRQQGWRREDVRCEVHVGVRRFEMDESGGAVLEAEWWLTEPGGGKTLVSRSFRSEKSGPRPDHDMAGAVGVMSVMLAELNREIGDAVLRVGP